MTAQGAWFLALGLILGAFWSTHFGTIFRGFERFLVAHWYDVPMPITLVPPKTMATIQSKEKGCWDGELYRPDLPQEKGVLVYQEAQTFARKQAAQA